MFSGMVQVSNQQLTDVSTYRNGMLLGTIGVATDGSLYRFAYSGAVALSIGKVTVGQAIVSNHSNLALDSTSPVAVNSNTLAVVLGGTAITQDQYLDGYAVINDGTGKGQRFRIAGNSAQTSTTGVATIFLYNPVTTLLALADTKVTLEPSRWGLTVVHPGSSGALLCNGVPQSITVPINNYYWSKTRGGASVLSDGIIAKGTGAILTTNAVAGALLTEASTTIVQRVAEAPEATVDTKYYTLLMKVD
jgi:hypothetical protein